jgi:hypothetical protein
MNIQSEIDFFSELGLIDKARFLSKLMSELSEEVKSGSTDAGDIARYRFAVEINQRLARLVYQLLSEDLARPQDDVVIRMLLSTRADKTTERLMHKAYSRVVTSFESHDTTVLLNAT